MMLMIKNIKYESCKSYNSNDKYGEEEYRLAMLSLKR